MKLFDFSNMSVSRFLLFASGITIMGTLFFRLANRSESLEQFKVDPKVTFWGLFIGVGFAAASIIVGYLEEKNKKNQEKDEK